MTRMYLKALRKAVGLKQEDVAEKLGMTQGAYSQIERGRNKQLPIQLIGRLAKLYGVKAEHIVSEEMRYGASKG